VILAGARTPIGKFGGAFKDVPAVTLGGHAIRAAIQRSGIEAKDVDYVIMGQVLQAGAGQITARQAAIQAGLPQEVPAITINKVCLSGLNAIALADQLIRAGEVEVVVAGGMESMSEAPYVVPKARFGARMGNAEMIDSMVHDGLWSTFLEQHMGESSDEVNQELEIGREEQDEWAARSHQRAHRGWESGALAEEVVPVSLPQRLTAQPAALLVTMGCGDQCPVMPGAERADWPLEDPKGQSIEKVRQIRDEIRRRVEELVQSRGWF